MTSEAVSRLPPLWLLVIMQGAVAAASPVARRRPPVLTDDYAPIDRLLGRFDEAPAQQHSYLWLLTRRATGDTAATQQQSRVVSAKGAPSVACRHTPVSLCRAAYPVMQGAI